jgi:hypothetical protein
VTLDPHFYPWFRLVEGVKHLIAGDEPPDRVLQCAINIGKD